MKATLSTADLTNEVRDKLAKIDERMESTIEGLEFIKLPSQLSDNAMAIEVARLSEGQHDWLPTMQVAQISFTELLPQAIDAFGLNLDREDVWFVPPSNRLLAIFHDSRDASATKGQTNRIVLGAGQTQALLIPRGVCYGLRNLHEQTSYVITLSSKQHDRTVDQNRLAWDFLGSTIFELNK